MTPERHAITSYIHQAKALGLISDNPTSHLNQYGKVTVTDNTRFIINTEQCLEYVIASRDKKKEFILSKKVPPTPLTNLDNFIGSKISHEPQITSL